MEKKTKVTELLVKDPIFSFIKEMINNPDSYFYTLIIAFSENGKFSKTKFEKFLLWVNDNLNKEGVFSFSQNKDKDYFKREVINYLEKIIAENELDLSDENLRKKVLTSLYNYIEGKIVDFDTMKELSKLLG